MKPEDHCFSAECEGFAELAPSHNLHVVSQQLHWSRGISENGSLLFFADDRLHELQGGPLQHVILEGSLKETSSATNETRMLLPQCVLKIQARWEQCDEDRPERADRWDVEVDFYQGRAQQTLQGSCVPKFYGHFKGEYEPKRWDGTFEAECILLEYVGDAFSTTYPTSDNIGDLFDETDQHGALRANLDDGNGDQPSRSGSQENYTHEWSTLLDFRAPFDRNQVPIECGDLLTCGDILHYWQRAKGVPTSVFSWEGKKQEMIVVEESEDSDEDEEGEEDGDKMEEGADEINVVSDEI
ncbi:hypothetical protein EIP91_008825 [Steccherinum ochraceum]|uniref:Uncharacterized protein n=1 Tax=Steccherinum ochraceum TaxID=92696 RepID=A0A4R0R4Z2_9APHY|nr:hypothetical protein EIP91_008825 [Steccherinum ochraceum]